MAVHLLCVQEPVSIALVGAGDRIEVRIQDGVTVSFLCQPDDLRQVLDGMALQLSADLGHCLITRASSGELHCEYSIQGHGRKACNFPCEKLESAIEEIRSNGDR